MKEQLIVENDNDGYGFNILLFITQLNYIFDSLVINLKNEF